MANDKEMTMGESRKSVDGLPKSTEATMMSKHFPLKP